MSGHLDPLESKLRNAWPTDSWDSVHVLLAVSGGADSVAMLRAACRIKQQIGGPGELAVAHYNHQIRGAAAQQDAQWVNQLASQLGVTCILGTPAPGEASAESEDQARNQRYRFLTQVAHQRGARLVAVAHTADDQVETVLHRLLRGTSVSGLSGIPFTRPLAAGVNLVRPLLAVHRSEVESYLHQLGQEYRRDSTNQQSCYTRNRLRNQVLPLLRETAGEGVDQAILRLAHQAGEVEQTLLQLAEEIQEQAIQIAGDRQQIAISPSRICQHPALLIREACKLAWRAARWPEQAMGHQQWVRLQQLLQSPHQPALMLPGDVRAQWQADQVLLSRQDGDPAR